MSTPTNPDCPVNFTVSQGERLEVDLTATNPDGTPLDLTAATIETGIKRFIEQSFEDDEFDVVAVDLSAGQIKLVLPAARTAALPAADYQYAVRIDDFDFLKLGTVRVQHSAIVP